MLAAFLHVICAVQAWPLEQLACSRPNNRLPRLVRRTGCLDIDGHESFGSA